MSDERRTRGRLVWSEQGLMRSEDIMRNPGRVHPRLRLMLLTPTEAGRDQSADDDLDPVLVDAAGRLAAHASRSEPDAQP